MDHRRQQVERIARAFYDAQEEALDWDSAPKFLKEEFCQNARDAIALLEQRRERLALNDAYKRTLRFYGLT
jgi:hypothetical protein